MSLPLTYQKHTQCQLFSSIHLTSHRLPTMCDALIERLRTENEGNPNPSPHGASIGNLSSVITWIYYKVRLNCQQ